MPILLLFHSETSSLCSTPFQSVAYAHLQGSSKHIKHSIHFICLDFLTRCAWKYVVVSFWYSVSFKVKENFIHKLMSTCYKWNSHTRRFLVFEALKHHVPKWIKSNSESTKNAKCKNCSAVPVALLEAWAIKPLNLESLFY